MTWEAPSPRQPVGAAGEVQAMLVAIGLTTVLVLAGISVIVAVGPWPGDLPLRAAHGVGMSVLAVDAADRQPGIAPSTGTPLLTSADADAIVQSVPGVTLISRVVFGTAPVNAPDQGARMGIAAVDPAYAQKPDVHLVRGAFFTVADASAANRVAVLGSQAAASLFAGAQSPVGQTIHIGDQPFTVVGVLGSQGSGPADAADGSVLIPFQTGQVRLFGATGLDEVLLQVDNTSQTQAIVQQIQQLLRTRHQVRAGQADGFTISTPSSAASAQFVDRLEYLSQQFACQAKTLCAPAAISG